MKITFPHMGNVYIPLKSIFEEIGADIVVPPKSSEKTLEIGTLHAPELMCTPFKITLGNYMESIKMGADVMLMWGGGCICRIGYYNTLQRDILNDLGYDIDMICIEPFDSLKQIKVFLNKLKNLSNTNSYIKLFTSFVKGLKVLNEVDEFENMTLKTRPRELNGGEVDRIYSEFESDISSARGYMETIEVINRSKNKLLNIKIDKNKIPIRVGVVGEIYTVVDPFINQYLVKRLGNMGVEVDLSVTTSEFIREHMDFLPFVKSHKGKVHKAAYPYLNTEIGGHARHTIGNTAIYGDKEFDGVIHLLPFTCMPEIVARSILPTIEKDKSIPVMTLVLDEMTGEAGYLTRIEAFIDLLQRRKEHKQYEGSISWS